MLASSRLLQSLLSLAFYTLAFTNASVHAQPSSSSLSISTSSGASLTSEPSAAASSLSVSSSSSTPTSTSSSDIPDPSPTDVPSSEFDVIRERRLERIVQSTTGSSNIQKWLTTQNEDGTWEDVNYATGCAAQRANWPAQQHWVRLQTLAAAWHGGLKGGSSSLVKNETVQEAISLGMDWWFDRDFTNPNCLYDGDTDLCPCDEEDEHLWNTNWYANVIGIPTYVGKVCLLMGDDALSATQASNCTNMPSRAYGSIGTLTGANVLDVAALGIDMALESRNESVILDAYERIHREMLIVNKTSADGTRPDGSFGQHIGLIYNGNYGKDYVNAILNLETQAADTTLSADQRVRDAFSSLIDGDKWMVFLNTVTGTVHWDFSVLPRFISFPVVDNQATSGLKINLTEVKELGEQWDSKILTSFTETLDLPAGNPEGANANGLTGNRMFYANDYMVHRGEKYVTTLKMLSTRAKTSECTNTQNPLGYHLSDGTLYTYFTGNEYEDISAAWDWNLIPGTTTFYNSTPLDCETTAQMGIEPFAGGVSSANGDVGVAAMKYANPLNEGERWQKAWFFLQGDVQHVMISNISSSNATILSVLDQKKHNGTVYVEAEMWNDVQALYGNGTTTYDGPQALWHAGVGYTFDSDPEDVSLIVELGEETGDWSLIGTSKQPNITVDLFSASLQHNTVDAAFAYTAYPGTETVDEFYEKKDRNVVDTVQNDADISAVYDWENGKALVVYWNPEGGSVDFSVGITLSSSTGGVLVFDVVSGELTFSDPTQGLNETEITLEWGTLDKTVSFELPSGGEAGKGVTHNMYFD